MEARLMAGGGSTATPDVRKSILSLGAVNALDMALQAALPMLLVRLLVDEDFGVYRTLWLMVTTALSLLSMAMPTSLFYFLPRSTGAERSAYLLQGALTMAGSALLGGAAVLLAGGGLDLRGEHRLPIAAFVTLWTFASLLDCMFNAVQRGRTQARVNLVFALLRFGAVAGVAAATHAIEPVLVAHLAFGAAKALTCAALVARDARANDGWRAISAARWREQCLYALPFGGSAGLYLLRARIDQWLVASMFSAAQFGLYSVASVFSPVQGLVRTTVNNVVLPELNRLQANDDVDRMLALNRRSNLAVSLLMFPVLAFLFAAATPLLTLLFTADYRGAAPVVRWYCATLMTEAVEVTMLLYAFRQGRFLIVWDSVLLVVSVAVCALGARLLGLSGAALGGLAGALIGQAVCLTRCAKLARVPLGALQPWGWIGRTLLAAVIAAGIAYGVLALLPDAQRVLALAAAAAAFCAAYWLGLRLLRMAPVVRDVLGARIARLLGF
ncbi:MAG: oligosaccharide flippase family protein [Burkholderiaceae bacterium]